MSIIIANDRSRTCAPVSLLVGGGVGAVGFVGLVGWLLGGMQGVVRGEKKWFQGRTTRRQGQGIDSVAFRNDAFKELQFT